MYWVDSNTVFDGEEMNIQDFPEILKIAVKLDNERLMKELVKNSEVWRAFYKISHKSKGYELEQCKRVKL